MKRVSAIQKQWRLTIGIRCLTTTTEAIIVAAIAVCIAHSEMIKMLLDIVSHETAGYD